MIQGTSALQLQTLPQEDTAPLKAEANDLMAAARALVVKDADDYRKAGAFFSSIKGKIKEIDAARTARVKPLNDTVKLINADYKAISDQLEAILKVVEAPMLAFKREEERQRREAEEAARKEQERIEREKHEAAEAERRRLEGIRQEQERVAAQAQEAQNPFQKLVAVKQLAQLQEQEAQAVESVKDNLREAAMVTVVADAPVKATAAGTRCNTNWKFRVVDVALVPREFMQPNEMLLGQIARTQKENAKVPGIEFFPELKIGGR